MITAFSKTCRYISVLYPTKCRFYSLLSLVWFI